MSGKRGESMSDEPLSSGSEPVRPLSSEKPQPQPVPPSKPSRTPPKKPPGNASSQPSDAWTRSTEPPPSEQVYTLKLHPLEFPPSRETIMSQGEESSRLLRSNVFNIAVRSATQSLQDAWLATAPEQATEREYLYAKAKALQDVLGELASCVTMAQALSERELADEESAAQAWGASEY